MPTTVASLAPTAVSDSASTAFTGSRDRFEQVVSWLEGGQAAGLSHGELEARLQVDARRFPHASSACLVEPAGGPQADSAGSIPVTRSQPS